MVLSYLFYDTTVDSEADELSQKPYSSSLKPRTE